MRQIDGVFINTSLGLPTMTGGSSFLKSNGFDFGFG